jgi:methionyl-tRNA formyltransferase
MRIGVAATPDVAIPTLEWLLQSDHEIALVITQPDRPAGRGREIKQTVVGDWAQKNKIELCKPETSQDLIGKIEGLDLVLTIGYGVLLPEEVLNLPKHGFLNLHFSLLPAHRGAAPVQRALENGESTTGVTVFQLEKGMDTGPIFSQISIKVQSRWRSVEMFHELALLGPQVVRESFEKIAAGEKPIAQNGTPTYAAKISKAEARIDFSVDAQKVVNLIRAFTYEPGAWTTWKNEPFKISDAIASEAFTGTPGEIKLNGSSVFVATEAGAIEILRVIPSGKKEMDAIDWARGARLSGGEHFG